MKRDVIDFRYKIFLNIKNIMLDYCNYVKGAGIGAFLIDIVAEGVQSRGNILQKCPLTGHLFLKDYVADLHYIPFILLPGEYSLSLKFFFKNQTKQIHLADFVIFATLKAN